MHLGRSCGPGRGRHGPAAVSQSIITVIMYLGIRLWLIPDLSSQLTACATLGA